MPSLRDKLALFLRRLLARPLDFEIENAVRPQKHPVALSWFANLDLLAPRGIEQADVISLRNPAELEEVFDDLFNDVGFSYSCHGIRAERCFVAMASTKLDRDGS